MVKLFQRSKRLSRDVSPSNVFPSMDATSLFKSDLVRHGSDNNKSGDIIMYAAMEILLPTRGVKVSLLPSHTAVLSKQYTWKNIPC